MGEFARVYKTDLTDRQIMAFWHQVEKSGRARTLAYDCAPLDAEGFCRWMRRPDVHPWFILFRGEPVGVLFLTEREGKTARVHFLTLPQGTKRTRHRKISVVRGFALHALAKILWERNVSGGFVMDTLIGVVPAVNGKAVKFGYSVGGEHCGVIPGACYFHDTGENVPGVVTVYTRDTVPEACTAL